MSHLLASGYPSRGNLICIYPQLGVNTLRSHVGVTDGFGEGLYRLVAYP